VKLKIISSEHILSIEKWFRISFYRI